MKPSLRKRGSDAGKILLLPSLVMHPFSVLMQSAGKALGVGRGSQWRLAGLGQKAGTLSFYEGDSPGKIDTDSIFKCLIL